MAKGNALAPAKKLHKSEQQKVKRYIRAICGYEECFGAAVLALRMLWELTFAHGKVRPDGTLIDLSGEDLFQKNKKELLPTEENVRLQINKRCHYQPEDDALTNAQKNQIFVGLVNQSREIICARFEAFAEAEENIAERELLNKLISMFAEFSQKAQRVCVKSADEQDEMFEQMYLDRLCENYFHNQKDQMADVFYLRYITEMIVRKRVTAINPDSAKTKLDELINELKKSKDKLDQELAEYAVIISHKINPLFHWYYTEEDMERVHRINEDVVKSARPLLASILTIALGEESSWTKVALLINSFKAPEGSNQRNIDLFYIKMLDDLREDKQRLEAAEAERQQKKAKQDLRDRIIMIPLMLIVLILLGLEIYYLFPHSGDAHPQISEDPVTDALWEEIPRVETAIEGAVLQEDHVNVVYGSGKQLHLSFEAVCNGEYSLRYSVNKRNAFRNQFTANPYGLANMHYALHSIDSEGNRLMCFNRWRENIEETGQVTIQKVFDPGWYLLEVQVVSAADGVVKDGVELNGSTGWIGYPLLVLPENEEVEWSLINRSTNTYAEKKDGLTIQEGDELAVLCEAQVQEGLLLFYSWDGGETWTATDGKITVPEMKVGMQTLQLLANYAYQSDTEYFDLSEFACIYEAAPLPQRNVELTVKDKNGNVLADGATLIAKPDDDIYLSTWSRYGIEKIRVWEVDSTGTEHLRFEKESISTISLGGSYGAKDRTIWIEVIGVGDGGELDSMNRQKMCLTIQYRTHENEYDEQGRVIKGYRYEDASSKSPTSYYRVDAYDEQGRELDWSYYTMDDQPCYKSEGSYHRYTISYDEGGSESWVYDLDGETLMEGTDTYGSNANGAAGKVVRQTETTHSWYFYGADRKLYANLDGIAGYEQLRDSNGNPLEERVYGSDGQPVLKKAGYHLVKGAYDGNRQTDEWYYDTQGNPCRSKDWYHHIHVEYDEYGNRISEILFDVDGTPLVRADGYVTYEKTFRPDTNLLESCRYLDETGALVLNTKLGYARVENRYNASGKLIEETFYGTDGNLIESSAGYARMEHIYETGREVISYYDAAGNLIPKNGQSWSRMIKLLDAYGHTKETNYYLTETELVGTSTLYGAARIVCRFTEDGELEADFYYDAQGNPYRIHNTNYCGRKFIFDPSQENVYYVHYLDENQQPIVNDDGFYRAKVTEDEKGRAILEERYLADGSQPEGDAIRRLEWTYHENGNTASYTEFTEPREGVICQTVRTYDESGNILTESFYDGLGERVEDETGVWQYGHSVSIFEEEKIEYSVFRNENKDASGSLVITEDGYAASEKKISNSHIPDYIHVYGTEADSESSNYEEIRYYGTDNRLMLNRQQGFAMYRRTSSASESIEAYYDTSGTRLMVNELLGYAKVVSTYEDGKLIRYAFYGADDQPCISHLGYAAEERQYDEEGNISLRLFYDADGKLMGTSSED